MTQLSPTCIVEESSAYPVMIAPAFVGSGSMGVGIDASGLQVTDSRIAEGFGLPSDADDLYVFRHGLLSSDLGQPYNLLPLGHLTWSLQVGQVAIDASNLHWQARLWRRTIDLASAGVETEMVVDHRIRVRIRCFAPFGQNAVAIEIGLKGYDRRNQPIAEATPVSLDVGVALRGRRGQTFFDRIEFSDSDACELHAANGYRDTSLRYRWHHGGRMRVKTSEAYYGLVAEANVADDEVVFHCMIDFSASSASSASALDFHAVDRDHRHDWSRFWSQVACIDVGDVEREFLFSKSLYLLRCGHDYRLGGTSGLLINHPAWWYACTFWDMQFICDGLLHANAGQCVRDFVEWLARVVRPTGRPFPWMMIHDGATPVNEADDMGIVVNLAFAMTALRAHNELHDDELFARAIWPICSRVCEFIATALFSREGDHYILGMPCGHDVSSMSESLINETYTAVWSLTILSRTLSLAESHQMTPSWASLAADIVANARIEATDEQYLHARAVSIEEFSYASWLPNLLYPTEALRFLDRDRYRRTRALGSFPNIYVQKQGNFQPWGYFWNACSDLRCDDGESAAQLIDAGCEHVYGPGYFCEVGPCQWGLGTIPPYPTACGAYLTATCEQLVCGDFWSGGVSLFVHLPKAWLTRTICVERIRSGTGVCVSATMSPQRLSATLVGRGDVNVRVRIPAELHVGTCVVRVNGVPLASPTWLVDDAIVAVKLSLTLSETSLTLSAE
jgi:hypothetical protein